MGVRHDQGCAEGGTTGSVSALAGGFNADMLAAEADVAGPENTLITEGFPFCLIPGIN